MNANVIYVLEKGKITETGSHDELLLQKGLYYAMWRQQVGERPIKTIKPEIVSKETDPLPDTEFL